MAGQLKWSPTLAGLQSREASHPSQAKMTAAVRPQWTPEKLEALVCEKIFAKTNSSEGQILPAMRLFVGAGSEIDLPAFEHTLGRLLNVDFQEGEVRRLFEKYDSDGGGSIDVAEFVAGVFPVAPAYGPGPGRDYTTSNG